MALFIHDVKPLRLSVCSSKRLETRTTLFKTSMRQINTKTQPSQFNKILTYIDYIAGLFE